MTHTTAEAPLTKTKVRYGLLIAAAAAVTALGYGGFRVFVSRPDMWVGNLYLLAVAAGVASFFSPCAFPLLPSYITFYYSSSQADNKTLKPNRAFQLGLTAALGVLTFDLLLGGAAAGLGAGFTKGFSISSGDPNDLVLGFRLLVGAALLYFGITQYLGKVPRLNFSYAMAYKTRPRKDQPENPIKTMYLYGLGYTAAGLGCTGPILAGLLLTALSTGIPGAAFGAFVVFSLTMSALMLAVSGLVASSQETLINQLKANAERVKKTGAIILVFVGIFNMYSVLALNSFLNVLFP